MNKPQPQAKKPVIANPKALLNRRMENRGLRRKTETALTILQGKSFHYQPAHEV